MFASIHRKELFDRAHVMVERLETDGATVSNIEFKEMADGSGRFGAFVSWSRGDTYLTHRITTPATVDYRWAREMFSQWEVATINEEGNLL
jgi:hypothetical protein